jgi:hypothetical protein
MRLAHEAALKVIDTFGENDFVGVVLFNNNVETFRKFLVPMTGKNSGKLKDYIEKDYCETCHGGGTNFQESIRMAFTVMEDSKNSRASSFCARAIMFLTDGVADFYDDDYAYVRTKASELQVAMLTYAIGNDADETVLKKVACENRGVFYKAEEGRDLGAIMSKYFLYYALGTRSCNVRWIEYLDWITDEPLLAGCLPFYSPTTTPETSALRGVSCVDMNMVVPLVTMKKHPSFSEFQCQTDFVSQTCEALYLRDCDLAAMRQDAGNQCPGDRSCTQGDGFCVDPTCHDDNMFKDSKGFYCDQWVGEDCEKATQMGYSQADQANILSNCPHSCLKCGRTASVEDCKNECDGQTGNVICRKRIKGEDMDDPASALNDASTDAAPSGTAAILFAAILCVT